MPLRQGQQQASYVLMHIVETVAAKYSGAAADDYETRNDEDGWRCMPSN